MIKSSNDYIHLSFLTGVTKFSKVSIFSDLNNLYDISFDREYSSLCGITEEELLSNFTEEVQALASEYNKTYDEMVDVLRARYDGYRFSKKEERIYNPFSLCNAFEAKKLGDYSFKIPSQNILYGIFKQKSFEIPDLEGNIKVSARRLNSYETYYEDLPLILLQEGYLTIKDYQQEFDMYILGYPNDEIKYPFLRELLKVYTNNAVIF